MSRRSECPAVISALTASPIAVRATALHSAMFGKTKTNNKAGVKSRVPPSPTNSTNDKKAGEPPPLIQAMKSAKTAASPRPFTPPSPTPMSRLANAGSPSPATKTPLPSTSESSPPAPTPTFLAPIETSLSPKASDTALCSSPTPCGTVTASTSVGDADALSAPEVDLDGLPLTPEEPEPSSLPEREGTLLADASDQVQATADLHLDDATHFSGQDEGREGTTVNEEVREDATSLARC